MKKFFSKYLFFLNLDSPDPRYSQIRVNIYIIISFLFLIIYKHYNFDDINSLSKLYSGFLGFTLIYLSAVWIEIYESKKIIAEIRMKLKEKNWKYETTEIYIVTTILTYFLIIITLFFVIEWEIVGGPGIKQFGFYGILVALLSIYQYRKYVKAMKKNKPAHIRKKELLEQKWWQKFFG